LDVASIGASGIVAVLGTAVGGRPVSDITEAKDITRYTSAEKASRAFRSGQLKDVANMLFSPAKDPDIPAGAVEYVAMKANPAVQSTGVLPNSDGPAIDLTSQDYGAFTEQITVDLQDGTTEGKLITITFEDLVESQDDLGGETLGKLSYVPGPDGFDTAVATVDAAGNTTVVATRASVGKDGDLDNSITAVAAEILSAAAGDTSLSVELFGLVAGVPTIELLTTDASDGTTVVTGTVVWTAGDLLGARVTGTSVGIITVRELGGAGVDVFTLPAGVNTEEGLITCDNCWVNNAALTLVSSGASTKDVIIFGRDVAGATLKEVVALIGTTPVPSVADTYAFFDVLVLGDVELAQTVTVTVEAAKALTSVQDTILKVNDYFNSKQQIVSGPTTEGFIYTLLTGQSNFDPANFDVDLVGQSILDPADFDYTADLYAIVTWINQNSQLITAAVSTGATGVPDNTSTPVPLTGGSEGVATFADYQTALNLLKRVRVNSIVDLSGDPAVAAALDAHIELMGGIGRSERDGFVGVLNSGLTDVPSKTEYKAAIVNLNTRHLRVFGQAIERPSPAGDLTEYQTPFLGAIVAGAQAGSPVGTSLTHKFMNVTGFRQHSTWNPTDDAEEMITGGACFLEDVEGVGRRVVRNVTSHLKDNNLAFVEASVNEAVNFAVFNFRTNMEFIVGKNGFSGTETSARANAVSTLGLLVDAFVLVGFRNLDVELILDIMDMSVEMAPVIPINFVRIVVHLVSLAQLRTS
jgi:hypothetical protein